VPGRVLRDLQRRPNDLPGKILPGRAGHLHHLPKLPDVAARETPRKLLFDLLRRDAKFLELAQIADARF
jgi:hypothetical protein